MISKLTSLLAFATVAFAVSFSMPSHAAKMLPDEPLDTECAVGSLSEMEECTNATLAVADRELETLYTSIRSKLQGESERSLVQAQKVWSAYREGQCNFQGTQMSGSTQAQNVTIGTCRLQETRERIASLKAVTL